MAFSAEMGDVGRPQARKLLHLLSVVVRILWRRLRTGAKVLYYPPAGPDLVPVLRDLVILLATRWAFDATVFHFHAGGLSEIWPRLPRALRRPFRAAYARPDLALQPSAMNPPDGEFLGARRTVVIPNGVPDSADAGDPVRRPGPPVILYVGVVRESKGVLVLVDACRRLEERGVEFELRIMGSFESPEFERGCGLPWRRPASKPGPHCSGRAPATRRRATSRRAMSSATRPSSRRRPSGSWSSRRCSSRCRLSPRAGEGSRRSSPTATPESSYRRGTRRRWPTHCRPFSRTPRGASAWDAGGASSTSSGTPRRSTAPICRRHSARWSTRRDRAYQAPRLRTTAGMVLSRIAKSRKTDQRSR